MPNRPHRWRATPQEWVPFSTVEAVAWHHDPAPGEHFGSITAVHAAALLGPDDGGGPNVDDLTRLGPADRLPVRTDLASGPSAEGQL